MWKMLIICDTEILCCRLSSFLKNAFKMNHPQRNIMENNGFHDRLHGTDGVPSLLMKDKDQSVTKTY